MTDTDPPPPINLDGIHLAPAWLSAFLATGDDDQRPALYRTILVELYPTGVQLVATNGVGMLGGYAPCYGHDLDPAPDLDEAPTATYVVHDWDLRAKALMSYVLTEARRAHRNDDPYPVRLALANLERPDTPTLTPELDRIGLELRIEGERLTLPIYEGDFPNWRAILRHPATPRPATVIDLDPHHLAWLGQLKAAPLGIRFHFDGPAGLVRFTTPSNPGYLFGCVAPLYNPDDPR